MATNFTLLSARLHLDTLLQKDPKGYETAEKLRAFRAMLIAEADKIAREAEAVIANALAEAATLRAQADALPADFDAKKPTQVADYATFGSPEGNTPNGFPNKPFTQAERHHQFLRAANLIEG